MPVATLRLRFVPKQLFILGTVISLVAFRARQTTEPIKHSNWFVFAVLCYELNKAVTKVLATIDKPLV